MAESKEDKKKLLDDAWESYKEHQEQESFNWVKEQYESLRAEQRKIIRDYLKDYWMPEDKKEDKRTGHGSKTYGSRRNKADGESRIGEPYDLSNWKWIDIEKEGKKILISLQPFDRDPKYKNHHALMDRLGIYLYKENSDETSDALDRMFLTSIDLPMDDGKLKKLKDVLDGIFSCWNEMEEAYKNKKLTDENKSKSEYKEKCEKIKLYNTVNEKQTLFEQIFDIVKEEK